MLLSTGAWVGLIMIARQIYVTAKTSLLNWHIYGACGIGNPNKMQQNVRRKESQDNQLIIENIQKLNRTQKKGNRTQDKD